MLFSHTLFSIPRKGSAVSPGRAFSLLTKNSTPKPNGVLFFLVLWLSVPLVAQGVDLVGKLGKILVGPALVVLDDAEQPLASADQPLEHCCGAGRALAGLVLQPDTGAFLQADRTLSPMAHCSPLYGAQAVKPCSVRVWAKMFSTSSSPWMMNTRLGLGLNAFTQPAGPRGRHGPKGPSADRSLPARRWSHRTA